LVISDLFRLLEFLVALHVATTTIIINRTRLIASTNDGHTAAS